MFAAMLHPTVYIAAGLGLGVVLLAVSYWQQNRQVKRQLADLQKARNDLKSINASNIGLGRRIKTLETRGSAPYSTQYNTPHNTMAHMQNTEQSAGTSTGAIAGTIGLVQDSQDHESLLAAAALSTAPSSIEGDTVSAQSFGAEAITPDTTLDNTRDITPDTTPDTIVAKDLRELQAHQQSLLQSLNHLEATAELEGRSNVSSFQESLANHLERDAVSEQYFAEPDSEVVSPHAIKAHEDETFDPYSYEDEPEADLEQTPYTRASAMLDEGLSLDEIERQSGLSKAEIKLMATMHKNMSNFALA